MARSKFNTDYIFLALLGVLLINNLHLSINNGYVLTLNNYAAFIAWVVALLLVITKNSKARYATPVLLLFGLFDVINFMAGFVRAHFSIGDISSPDVNGIGFNPVIFLLCIAYYFVKRKTVNGFFAKRLNDNEQEKLEKQDKMISFYYSKFLECDADEFNGIIRNYSNYSPEAQKAINKIKAERAF